MVVWYVMCCCYKSHPLSPPSPSSRASASLLSPMMLTGLFTSAAGLPAAAARPVLASPRGSSIRIPVPTGERTLSPVESLLLAAFRWQTQQQTGCKSDEPGFAGMLEEVRVRVRVRVRVGVSVRVS